MSDDGTARRRATENWLKAQGLREDVTPEEYAELKTLLAPHKGFGILWSIIMHDRAEYLVALTNLTLTSPDRIAQASVLQGQIRNIDRLHELVLNIADPLGSAAVEDVTGQGQEMTNGR